MKRIVICHRLLDAALTRENPKPHFWNPLALERVAKHCNDRKTAAKRASESSEELFLGLFIKESGQVDTWGMVVQVLDHAFDVLILEMATVKRVYVDKASHPVTRHEAFHDAHYGHQKSIKYKKLSSFRLRDSRLEFNGRAILPGSTCESSPRCL